MGKLSKRAVDQATPRDADYFIWDDELPGFGLRVFTSGRRSYVVQYRAKGRTRRFTIGVHGVWTPETARREARVLLGRIAQGDNPAEQRELDHRAITVKELCERYMADAKAGLILGKKQRPKKASTIYTDEGRIKRHIVPLLGTRRVKDLTSADVTQFMRDIASGKTKADVKTRRRGRAIVRGGIGTGRRTVGFLGALLTYAREAGIIETNPAHGIRKAADQKRTRRLSEDEYRLLPPELAAAAPPADTSLIEPRVQALIATSGAEFRIGGERAYYDVLGDFIRVPPPQTYFQPIDWHRTALHELGHWTGHSSRLGREIANSFGSKKYAQEELVAEMTAAFTCASLGIVPTVRHADYIGSWLEVLREDNRAIVRAASAASKAADFLLAFAPGGEGVNASPDAGHTDAPEGEFGLTQRPTRENPAAMSGCER